MVESMEWEYGFASLQGPFCYSNTYITDYYTKDESGATKFLKEAAKKKFSTLKDKNELFSSNFSFPQTNGSL